MRRLYLLAIMPPQDISDKIRKIQEEFAEEYNCKAALKNKVHVTLIPPFWATEDEIESAIESVKSWTSTQQPFQLPLTGFESFKRNQVIFIDVKVSEALLHFQKALENIFIELFPGKNLRSNRPYHPHFTIGYRDIPKERFKEAEAEYLTKEFTETFLLVNIYLWKNENKGWQIIEEFPFCR